MTFFFSFLLRFTSYLHPCCPCHLMAAVPFRSLPCASTQDTFQASAVLLRDCPNKTFSSCRPPARQPRRHRCHPHNSVSSFVFHSTLFCFLFLPIVFFFISSSTRSHPEPHPSFPSLPVDFLLVFAAAFF